MLILPSTPSGTTIFCDDVRHEITGKTSLIGVYQDTMSIVSNEPILVPQLCILTKIRLTHDELPISFLLKIIFEDEKFEEQIIQEMELDFPAIDATQPLPLDTIFSDKEGVRYVQLQTEARLINFPITKGGRIKIRMFVGDKQIALGSLRCLFMPQNNSEPT
jgi:hypothetical protein